MIDYMQVKLFSSLGSVYQYTNILNYHFCKAFPCFHFCQFIGKPSIPITITNIDATIPVNDNNYDNDNYEEKGWW